jgi:O-antigen/teichoic acid export membrane protein
LSPEPTIEQAPGAATRTVPTIRGLLRSVSLTSLAILLAKALGLISLPIIARSVGVTEYGFWDTLMMTFVVGALIARLGMDQATCHFVGLAQDANTARTYATTGVRFVVVGSLVTAAAFIALSPALDTALFSGRLPMATFMVAAGLLICEALLLFVNDLLRFTDRLRWYLVGTTGVALVFVLALVSLEWSGSLTITTALAGYLVAEAVTLGVLVFVARGHLFFRADRRLLQPMLRFGFPTVFSASGFLVMSVADRFILAAYRLYDDLGLYAMAYRLSFILAVVLDAFGAMFMPFVYGLYRADPNLVAERLRLIGRWYVFISCLLGLAIVALAQPLAVLIGGPDFEGAALAVPLLTAAALANAFGNRFCVGIDLRRRTGYRAAIAGAAAGLNMALNFVLIPPYGMMGAAVATFCAYLAASIVHLAVSEPLLPVAHPLIGAHLAFCVVAGATIPLLPAAPTVALYVYLVLAVPAIAALLRIRLHETRALSAVLLSSRALRRLG